MDICGHGIFKAHTHACTHHMPAGYNAYLGFLYLDYAYNNAVVHTFVKLLYDLVKEKRLKRDNAEHTSMMIFCNYDDSEDVSLSNTSNHGTSCVHACTSLLTVGAIP